MRFSHELRDAVADGDMTVSIRLWQRPQVKVGGRYRADGVEIEVDSVEVMPFSAVTSQDLSRSGEVDREALRRRAAHAGPVDDDTLVHRIEFHVVARRGPAGADPVAEPDRAARAPAGSGRRGARR